MKSCNISKFRRCIGVTEKLRNFVHEKVMRIFQKLRISIAILKHPRWVKLDTLFFATVYTLKQTFLLHQEHKKKTQNKLLSFKSNENKTKKSKYYRVASCKALSLEPYS
jgi:hypothetical protein